MSKFNVGDRVRIVSFMGNDFSPLTGITGTVTDTPGYGTIVNLDHGIRLYGAYSNTVSDLLLILDKELEYEDNKRNAITGDFIALTGDYVFTHTMRQCDEDESKWFVLTSSYRQGDFQVATECLNCTLYPKVIIPRTEIGHFGYLCNQPSLPSVVVWTDRDSPGNWGWHSGD